VRTARTTTAPTTSPRSARSPTAEAPYAAGERPLQRPLLRAQWDHPIRPGGPTVHALEPTPALHRLEWILEGLAGAPDWGGDAEDAVAPAFRRWRSPEDYVALTRARSDRYAPLRIVGLETSGHRARARLYNNAGEVDVLTCSVELEPPHRIAMTA